MFTDSHHQIQPKHHVIILNEWLYDMRLTFSYCKSSQNTYSSVKAVVVTAFVHQVKKKGGLKQN